MPETGNVPQCRQNHPFRRKKSSTYKMRRSRSSFYRRNTVAVARELLGKFIIRKIGRRKLVGKIVETEAYHDNDPASHAYRGITPRCAPMFEEPGHAYVYFIYGNHYCLNFVTERYGKAGAVLIRAIEPVSNIKTPTMTDQEN